MMRLVVLCMIACSACDSDVKGDVGGAGGIDDQAARILADAVAANFIAEKYKDMREQFDPALKETVPQDGNLPAYAAMHAMFGKPLEVRFSKVVRGNQYGTSGARAFQKIWYDVRTTTAEMGEYFLWVDIVRNGDALACSGISYAKQVSGAADGKP